MNIVAKLLRHPTIRSGLKTARRIAAAVPAPKKQLGVELARPWFRAYDFQTIIDVGANEGQFAALARAAFPAAHLCCFEPLPDCRRTLEQRFARDLRFESFGVALGARAGQVEMYRNDFTPSSSLLALDPAHIAAFPQTEHTTALSIQLRTLDEVLASRALAGPILLKIDVQGYEAQVLAGGAQVLARCDALIVEMSLERLYRDEPLFDELYRQIHAAGFALRGYLGMLRRPSDGQPLQVDAVFDRRALS